MTDKSRHKRFTGWHMTAILVAFFAVVVAVNFTMARIAMSTFGGKVVENSYVASQQYNDWLRRAAAQDRLGWNQHVSVDGRRFVVLEIRKDGRPLDGLSIVANRSHPLGRTPSATMRFVAVQAGTFRSTAPLLQGRWRLDLTAERGADRARYRVDLQ